MKRKLMATSPTKEGLQKLINEFYFSQNYIITNNNKLENSKLNGEKLKNINNKSEIKNTIKGWYYYILI
jgi:hypothetical protein